MRPFLLASLLLVLTGGSALAAPADYPVFQHDAQRSGVNPNETAISGATVAGLHRLWGVTLDQPADSSAIYLSGVAGHDLVYVTTKRGVTYAFDTHNGQQVWKASPNTGPLRDYQITTSTPAADPSRQWIYAASPDGKVRRYNAATGQETIGGGWPVTVSIMPDVEKISSALNVANGYLYVTTSGYNGDFGPYDGHLVAIRLADASSTVFNTLCAGQRQLVGRAGPDSNTCGVRESGVWARGGAVVDQNAGPTSGVVYIDSGNGAYDGSSNFGDSVMALSPDASVLFGSYTPSNYQALDDGDVDLGSMAPVPLPQQAKARTPWLAALGGKDGILRLIDRAHMGGLGADLADLQLGIGQLLPAPVVWVDGAGTTWIYAAGDGGLVGVQVTVDGSGNPGLRRAWRVGQGGTSPVMAGNVLFISGHGGNLHAYDPEIGAELWNTSLPWTGGGVAGVHWESPTVTAGMLFMPDEAGHLTAYGL